MIFMLRIINSHTVKIQFPTNFYLTDGLRALFYKRANPVHIFWNKSKLNISLIHRWDIPWNQNFPCNNFISLKKWSWEENLFNRKQCIQSDALWYLIDQLAPKVNVLSIIIEKNIAYGKEYRNCINKYTMRRICHRINFYFINHIIYMYNIWWLSVLNQISI
mgnify:CR=1 FL=1